MRTHLCLVFLIGSGCVSSARYEALRQENVHLQESIRDVERATGMKMGELERNSAVMYQQTQTQTAQARNEALTALQQKEACSTQLQTTTSTIGLVRAKLDEVLLMLPRPAIPGQTVPALYAPR